jgi:uncharacterized protein (TIGR03435 family)
MGSLDDAALLAAYVSRHSEEAFATLVERHVSLVYSSALRQVRNPHVAEEVTQAVFIILARKAGHLGRETVLAGWLCRTAHLTACNALKVEHRRQHREQEAYMESLEPTPETWPHMAPLLDEAVAQLGEADRNAVVLRYYQQKPLEEVGKILGLNADTAQKRVSRALEKLRKFFAKRGLTLSALAIAGAVSANSVQAAPAGLAQLISTVALAKGAAAGGSTLTLAKGALKVMAWTKAKTAVVVAASAFLAVGTTTVTVEKIHEHQNEEWQLGQNNTSLLSRPPYRTVILPTLVAKRNPRYGTGGMGWTGDGRIMGINAPIEQLVRAASLSNGVVGQYRTVLAAEVPTNKYDFFSNLPAGAKEALRREIKKRFGVAGRFETIETNVLFLQVKYPNAAGLKPSLRQGGSSSAGNGTISEENASTDDLALQLENTCETPVLNQTGLTNRYDFKIHWKEYGEKVGGAYPNYPNVEGLKRALIEQLGLELVSGTAPVEMLMVEKVPKSR